MRLIGLNPSYLWHHFFINQGNIGKGDQNESLNVVDFVIIGWNS
jgi:hypothetical protein